MSRRRALTSALLWKQRAITGTKLPHQNTRSVTGGVCPNQLVPYLHRAKQLGVFTVKGTPALCLLCLLVVRCYNSVCMQLVPQLVVTGPSVSAHRTEIDTFAVFDTRCQFNNTRAPNRGIFPQLWLWWARRCCVVACNAQLKNQDSNRCYCR